MVLVRGANVNQQTQTVVRHTVTCRYTVRPSSAAVIMFKSYWLAVVLAGVTGLSVMTDAQSTDDDETASCAGAAGLLDVITSQVSGVKKLIASECEKATVSTTLVNELRDVKRLLESGNETRLEAVVTEMKGEIRDEIRDVKRTIASGCEETNVTRVMQEQTRDEIRDVKIVLESGNETRLEDVFKEIKDEIRDEIRDVKRTIGCEDANETMLAEVAKEIKDEITGVKRLIGSGSEDGNETRLEEVVNMIGVIASNQQENTNEIRDVKRLLVSGNETRLEAVVEEMKGEIADEITDVKRKIASGCEDANDTRLGEIEKVVKESKDEMKEIKEEIEEKITGVKNETTRVLDVLENVVNAIKTIASNQQKTADEMREVKRLLASNQSACECENSTCPSPPAQQDTAPVVVNSTDCIPVSTTVSPPQSSSKQALVSALVCEYQRLLSVKN